MAIVRSLAIGKAVNSAGPLTYQTVKGRTIAREKPVHVANPNTPAQQAQRGKMRNIVAAWREWFFLLSPYFTAIQGYGSGYNEFVRRNIHLADQPWYEDEMFYPSRFKGAVMSTGKYGAAALNISPAEELVTVGINDLQLRGVIEEGDQIVVVRLTDDAEAPTLTTKVLDAEDVEALAGGDTIGIATPVGGYTAAFFYSSARRLASVGVMTADA